MNIPALRFGVTHQFDGKYTVSIPVLGSTLDPLKALR